MALQDIGIMAFTNGNDIEKNRNKYLYVFNCGYFLIHNKTTTLHETASPAGYLLLYQHQGSLRVLIQGKYVKLNAGHVLIYQPQQIRDIIFEKNDKNYRYFIYFQGEGAKYYLNQLSLSDKIIYKTGDLSDTLKIYEDIVNDYKVNDYDHDLNRTLKLLTLLKIISGKIKQNNDTPKTSDPKIIEIINDMRSSFQKNIPLSAYAERYRIPIPTLIRHFKKETGTTPIKFITNLKIETAQSFLTHTDMKISDIAFNLGFIDPLYFSNFFKKNVGESPTLYREKNKIN